MSDALSSCYLFRGLTPEQLGKLEALTSTRQYEGGEVILRQFQRTDDMFVLLDGKAKVKSFSGEDVAELTAPCVFGEVALIDQEPRSATVSAVGTSLVATLSAGRLRALLKEDVDLRIKLFGSLSTVLCQRLRVMNIQLEGAMEPITLAQRK